MNDILTRTQNTSKYAIYKQVCALFPISILVVVVSHKHLSGGGSSAPLIGGGGSDGRGGGLGWHLV